VLFTAPRLEVKRYDNLFLIIKLLGETKGRGLGRLGMMIRR